MPQLATNTDLPSSNLIPGVYFQLNLKGSSPGLSSSSKSLLLLGYHKSTGTAAPNSIVQVTQQSETNTKVGAGSDLARMYAAATAQVGGGVMNTFLCPVSEPSGGTAATYLIAITGPATAAGSIDLWLCGHNINVPIANGDTNTVIGTALTAAINLNTDIPVTASGTTTVTLTYVHKGIVGEDFPIICNLNNATGVTLSPGTITVTGDATSTASAVVEVNGQSVTTTITNLDAAATIATNIGASINAGDFPVTATVDSTTVTLLYAKDRVVRRITASDTATGTAVAAVVGTAGAGTPTLTTALTNIAAQSAFKVWCTSFNEATSLGTISTHIELYANGVHQKGQRLHAASVAALATAGAIPDASSPKLTASTRYDFDWPLGWPQQAYEIAARTAAIRCIQDYSARNYDGMRLTTRGTVPLLMPEAAIRPIPDDINAAMYSYHMTPIVVDGTGNAVIVRAMTTSTDADRRLWDWGTIDTFDYFRDDLRTFLYDRFKGKNIKWTGTAFTQETITKESIEDSIYERATQWERADLFDGIDALKDYIQVTQNAIDPGRADIAWPMRKPSALHQMAGVGNHV